MCPCYNVVSIEIKDSVALIDALKELYGIENVSIHESGYINILNREIELVPSSKEQYRVYAAADEIAEEIKNEYALSVIKKKAKQKGLAVIVVREAGKIKIKVKAKKKVQVATKKSVSLF